MATIKKQGKLDTLGNLQIWGFRDQAGKLFYEVLGMSPKGKKFSTLSAARKAARAYNRDFNKRFATLTPKRPKARKRKI